MKTWVYTLVSVSLISLISLVGIFGLFLNKERVKSLVLFLVSFAVGGLFGDSFIHLIPESFKELGIGISTSFYILVGIFIFFILEKFIRWRHCHIPASEEHLHPVAILNLIGDALHNFIDGMIVGASFNINISIGIATSMAVIFHEIPQEIGDFGVLLYTGMRIKKALFLNFLSGLTSIVGAVAALLIESYLNGFSIYLMPVAAGGFLYIAGSDLIPELHKEEGYLSRAVWQFVLIVFGVMVMALLLLFRY